MVAPATGLPAARLTAMLTLPEVAALLRCSSRTLLRWVSAGIIPASRIGRRLLFHPDDVQRALIGKLSRVPGQTPPAKIDAMNDLDFEDLFNEPEGEAQSMT